MLENILIFVKVVNSGSILAAEKILSLSKSSISRKMQELEAELGVTLLNRNMHGIQLTMTGYSLYEKFRDYEEVLASKLYAVSNHEKQAAGKLNILLPYTFSEKFIIPRLNKILCENPLLQINLEHDFRYFNMRREQYDVAIINYMPSQQTQKIKLIASDKIIFVCTGEYLEQHGHCNTINEYLTHVKTGRVAPDGTCDNTTLLVNELTEEISILKSNPQFFVNNFADAKIFAMNHNGITCLPQHYIEYEIRLGNLVRVLSNYHAGVMDYYLLRNIAENDPRFLLFNNVLSASLREFAMSVHKSTPSHLFHR